MQKGSELVYFSTWAGTDITGERKGEKRKRQAIYSSWKIAANEGKIFTFKKIQYSIKKKISFQISSQNERNTFPWENTAEMLYQILE